MGKGWLAVNRDADCPGSSHERLLFSGESHAKLSPSYSSSSDNISNQLGAMVDLYHHARLPTDVGPNPKYFVLAMTVCGEEWTVEYAVRLNPHEPENFFTTLARGNWAEDPSAYLHAVREVLLHSLVYMEEKLARMGQLLRVPGAVDPSAKVKLHPRTYGTSPEAAKRRAAKTKKQLEKQEREAKELESQEKAAKQQAGKGRKRLTKQPLGEAGKKPTEQPAERSRSRSTPAIKSQANAIVSFFLSVSSVSSLFP